MIIELKEPVGGMVVVLQDLNYLYTGYLDFDKDSVRADLSREVSVQIPDYFMKYYCQVTDGDLRYFINGENQGLRIINSMSGDEAVRYLSDIAGKLMRKYPDWADSLMPDTKSENTIGNAVHILLGLWMASKLKSDGVWDCVT